MEMKDRLRKLSRYELVELIYDLRRDNVELEKRLREAEIRVSELEQLGGGDTLSGRLQRMEDMLESIERRITGTEE